ncbi:MAG: YicC family protein [Gammaproteobacteria bacterium]|nr:YicC family protein [Gammaproteobacteria bacterium]MDH5304891.1 YicC family protein [Gammaproteobacteria bacterium]MDH5322818.1 YicC family protein [Gammaproteobacteria bacterium]
MLHSMTGFARQSAETAFGTLSWELRAVNHRYLEVQFRLPEELRPKEQLFKQQVATALKRGKVDCSLHFRRIRGAHNDLQLDTELVTLIARRAAEIAASLPAAAAVNPLDVLRWPGVVAEPEIDEEPLLAASTELLDETLAAMASMRASEGERIMAMISSRCDELAGIAAAVRQRMPEVLAAVRNKQRERLERLDVTADPARLELELALAAQRLDVDEELDRIDSHLVEIREALTSDEPVGRRLDFLMQELNREANTLGSKSADAATTRAAVELKVLIEQMREQIQNIE